MKFSAVNYPYGSRRTVVFGARGMVAASQPLAAQAGLAVLRQGGNAVDAAVAAAAALPVLEPTSNGIGGDLFALVHYEGRLYGLNASGPAPMALTAQTVRAAGFREELPKWGWLPVTVPGIPAGWAALAERFGKLSLQQSLAPAVEYARDGHPVAAVVSQYWKRAAVLFGKTLSDPVFEPWFDTFTVQGRAPQPGEVWACPDMAATLDEIGSSGARSFYDGELARRTVAYAEKTGGFLRADDLAGFSVQWVEPLSINYRGYTVSELPPNGQGLVALSALGILDKIPYRDDPGQWFHYMIEAVKLAFADGRAWITDPEAMPFASEELLAPSYLDRRRDEIGEQAQIRSPGTVNPGGTVYLAAADGSGTMVSLIQSNYMGFGSGIVVPGTGIALQNRGHNFSLDPDHPNYLRPGKRSYHTIIPGFLSRNGQPIGPFGVMGGFMQPQGHVQVLSRCLDEGLNPQAALDAPRFFWSDGLDVHLEPAAGGKLLEDLRRRGHAASVSAELGIFGRGQIIWKLPGPVLAGATEPRADGMVSAW